MKKFKVKYYTRAYLSYTVIDAPNEDSVTNRLKMLGIIKNKLQIHSIEEEDDYDDSYEPDLYPTHFKDKASKYFHDYTDTVGNSVLFNLNWVKPNPEISPVFNVAVDGEQLFEFNEHEHRKIGVVMCGLFAPHMDCDEYRFEYTMVAPQYFKFDKNEVNDLLQNYQKQPVEFEALSQWMEDTRVHPVFVMKDKRKVDFVEGKERMMAADYFDEQAIAVVIAHKIYD